MGNRKQTVESVSGGFSSEELAKPLGNIQLTPSGLWDRRSTSSRYRAAQRNSGGYHADTAPIFIAQGKVATAGMPLSPPLRIRGDGHQRALGDGGGQCRLLAGVERGGRELLDDGGQPRHAKISQRRFDHWLS